MANRQKELMLAFQFDACVRASDGYLIGECDSLGCVYALSCRWEVGCLGELLPWMRGEVS